MVCLCKGKGEDPRQLAQEALKLERSGRYCLADGCEWHLVPALAHALFDVLEEKAKLIHKVARQNHWINDAEERLDMQRDLTARATERIEKLEEKNEAHKEAVYNLRVQRLERWHYQEEEYEKRISELEGALRHARWVIESYTAQTRELDDIDEVLSPSHTGEEE
jgi:chromosome segregation ATPase